MTILIWTLLVLFWLKLGWNVWKIVEMVVWIRVRPELRKTGRWFVPPVEVVLLALAGVLSEFSHGASWVNRPWAVLGWGFVAILTNCLLMFVVAIVGAHISLRWRRPRPSIPQRARRDEAAS